MGREVRAGVPIPPWKGPTMSEIVLFVESITTAGWAFLCGLGVVAMGLLVFDRHRVKKAGVEEAARPGARHAA